MNFNKISHYYKNTPYYKLRLPLILQVLSTHCLPKKQKFFKILYVSLIIHYLYTHLPNHFYPKIYLEKENYQHKNDTLFK